MNLRKMMGQTGLILSNDKCTQIVSLIHHFSRGHSVRYLCHIELKLYTHLDENVFIISQNITLIYRVSKKQKLCKQKASSFEANKKQHQTYITFTNELVAFECCLFRRYCYFPRLVKIPIVPLVVAFKSKDCIDICFMSQLV